MLTSGYYIPTELQARQYWGGIDYPIPAPTWVSDDVYLIKYEYRTKDREFTYNWPDSPAQYANEVLLYDYNYTCLQGSAKLDNGHYIACDTTYTWDGFYKDDENHTREDLIGFRWASEAEGSVLNSLEPFKTVAVCDTSTIKGTIQIRGLPDASMRLLKQHGNSDAIFNVVDVGQGLCSENSKDGNTYIDIFTGMGEQAFKDARDYFFGQSVDVCTYNCGH